MTNAEMMAQMARALRAMNAYLISPNHEDDCDCGYCLSACALAAYDAHMKERGDDDQQS